MQSLFPEKICHGTWRSRGVFFAFASVLALAACGSGGSSWPGSSALTAFTPPAVGANSPAVRANTLDARATTPAVRAVKLSLSAQVGQKIFFDKNLSASGKLSCASCHDPDRAYGPPNDLAVQLGGPALSDSGVRAVPSLRYNEFTPAYADLLDNPDGISAPGPGGGFTWDGRANTLAEQAKAPLLSAFEMANASIAEVVAKLERASYAALFQRAFGKQAFDDADAAFNNALAALQAFQLEDPSFHPYSSKFDLHAGNKIGGTLTAAEARGMKVFTDPKKGNCSSCHFQGAGLNGSTGLFTDFSYAAIGVPRNAAIPANSDARYYDLGVCGPLRSDHLARARGAANAFCGMFKTPTLRNVATRNVFFHNGAMHSLEQAIRFYNTRDTMPEIWYPSIGGRPKTNRDPGFPAYGLITTQYAGGTARKFDDLPAAYRVNIDTQMPLDGRRAASAPPLDDQNIADLICFLNTLTDDYQPPSSPPASGPCID